MKRLILLLILSPTLLLSQIQKTKPIIIFDTVDRNQKSILFAKKETGDNISYVLSAENKTSKDFAKCKWLTSMSRNDTKSLINALETLEKDSSIESDIFNLTYNKNKIIVKIKQTKCTSKHKTYYFQKSCKRALSFILLPDMSSELIAKLKAEIDKSDFAINKH